MAKEPKGQKHHYIPCFYLKQWVAGNGCLCEFSKPYKTVVPRRTSPDGTGYIRGLNTIKDLPPEEADYLENVFFKFADDAAARALRILLAPPPWNMTVDEKSGWSRFIMSLVHRHPELVEKHRIIADTIYAENLPAIKADYAARKKPDDPPIYEEYTAIYAPNPAGRILVKLLQSLIDSEVTGGGVNSLRWTVLHDPQPKHLLLTSDRPVIMTNGLNKPDGHLVYQSRRATFSSRRIRKKRLPRSAMTGKVGNYCRE